MVMHHTKLLHLGVILCYVSEGRGISHVERVYFST